MATLVGVLSDTHLTRPDPELSRRLAVAFQGVEMILHAGDITNLAVLDSLPAVEVVAVAGNMDSAPVAAHLPSKRTLTVAGFRLGLIHGWGARQDLASRVRHEFKGVDCIVFGHAHQPTNLVLEGVLMFNPGAAQYPGGTVGILTLDQQISGRIVEL